VSKADNFPQPGETRPYYCSDCKKIVDWEMIEKDGKFYWYAADCGKMVLIGKWPDTETK
jgi:hypothetical protein